MSKDPTLNEVLQSLGFTTQKTEFGKKHIVKQGVIVFTGDANAVWEWLREEGHFVSENGK